MALHLPTAAAHLPQVHKGHLLTIAPLRKTEEEEQQQHQERLRSQSPTPRTRKKRQKKGAEPRQP
ncbi:hypothetical protein E2C01_098347 [Portunus trituberculatus]|uniref:Uncharacterized protein n=1 Tax=Portunus trituberculatus TaxID=210409 RepID=A0A5B7KDZ1_PORTR|nr:hypothetical protein [Portunus trituberculatus]